MEIDEVIIKESPGLCRCCLSEGCYKDLASEYPWMGENEVYADMLLECFDIGISQHADGPNGPNRLICEVCITRLRDACNFKKQVVEAEKRFVDMLGRGDFRMKNTHVVEISGMKLEPTLEEDPPEEEVEYLEDIDFGDDEPLQKLASTSKQYTGQSTSNDAAVPAKKTRGRPRKSTATVKVSKSKTSDIKPKATRTKGEIPKLNNEGMTSNQRNKLMKNNAITIIENSNVCPFKWLRQNYLCFFCHNEFKDFEILKLHTRQTHTNMAKVKTAVGYLRRDGKTKIEVTELQCKICNDSIKDIDALVSHLKESHAKRFEDCSFGVVPYKFDGQKWTCPICGKDFLYFVKLNQHMNSHYGNYICHVCGKGFMSFERLECHKTIHMPVDCKLCNLTLDSAKQLKRHEINCHGTKLSLKCVHCDATFENYNTRRQHYRMSHNYQFDEYPCAVCGKVFQIKSKMELHYREVHIKERNFTCKLCDKRFFSRSHVQKHTSKHCSEKTHECGVCMKSYNSKKCLSDHLKTH